LRDKIFIGFPGTERGFQWFQNIFRVGNLNGQLSYDENIRTLFNEKGDLGFIEAINKHIKFRKSQGYTINNDFYFIGHSRGGGLSLVAARKFREEIQRGLFREFLQDGDVRIKIVTFCAPKVYSFLPMHHQCIKEFGFENIVHFSNKAIPIPFPSISLFEVEDPAPQFPFYWPKNLGINVPVTVIGMPHVVHNIPSTTDINSAIRLYNSPSEHSLYFIPSLFKGSCWFLLGALYAHGSELTRINSLRHVLNLFEFSGDIAKNLTISFLKLFSYKLPESFKDLLDRRGLG
jgi:pimeloyl-ACP methyl ester carboxylesterase